MKKSLQIVSSMILFVGAFVAFAFANPVAFIVEVNPSSFEVNEAVDLTIRAIDGNNQTVQDYDGDVWIEVTDIMDFTDYVVPSD